MDFEHQLTALERLVSQAGIRFSAVRYRNKPEISPLIAGLEGSNGFGLPREWSDRIASLRRALLSSNEMVTYMDYGVRDMRHAVGYDGTVDRRVREIARSSVPNFKGEFLHGLVRATRPEHCVELGTCLGVSAAYIASALDVNKRGRLYTLEGGEPLSEIATRFLRTLSLRARFEVVTGRFAKTLGPLLERLEKIQFVHIDGHHTGEALLSYVATMRPFFAESTVVVTDDIHWPMDMRKAWKSLKQEAAFSVTLGTAGVLLYR